jgi:hypothetical protein
LQTYGQVTKGQQIILKTRCDYFVTNS